MTVMTIAAQPNKSYKVAGPVRVVNAKGEVKEFGEGEEVFLCRCGCSKNKPYCDGSHKACEFKDE